jgi:putative ABC transport system permease protein
MTTPIIHLSYYDLAWAAAGFFLLGLTIWWMRLGQFVEMWVNATRLFVQLMFMGVWLGWVFSANNIYLVFGVIFLMMGFAVIEIVKRQQKTLKRQEKVALVGISILSLFFTSITVGILVLMLLVKATPWWAPQYFIPIVGMILGNAMTTIGLAFHQLIQDIKQQSKIIDAKLALGFSVKEAMLPIQRNALQLSVMPIINSMAAAGVITLPGMMSGQILAGVDPSEAVKYQILILLVVAFANILAAIFAIKVLTQKYFDARARLKETFA